MSILSVPLPKTIEEEKKLSEISRGVFSSL